MIYIAAIVSYLSPCWLRPVIKIHKRWHLILLRKWKKQASLSLDRLLVLNSTIHFADLLRREIEFWTFLYTLFGWEDSWFVLNSSLARSLVHIFKPVEIISRCSHIVSLPVGRGKFDRFSGVNFIMLTYISGLIILKLG